MCLDIGQLHRRPELLNLLWKQRIRIVYYCNNDHGDCDQQRGLLCGTSPDQPDYKETGRGVEQLNYVHLHFRVGVLQCGPDREYNIHACDALRRGRNVPVLVLHLLF